jgi:hypothetical protein
MTQLDGSHSSRYCAECREERVFGRFHADLGSCPDVPDGDCPELGCTSCGDALIIGVPAASGYAGSDRAIRAA